MANILVLGAGGMAGHLVATYLREQGHAVDTLSAKNRLDDKTMLLDVRDSAQLDKFLQSGQYDIVVNCIALLGANCDKQPDLAAHLNAYLPHLLEQHYLDSATRIIHISTDGVFSGNNPPYTEESAYDGQTFYDRSKALGELRNDKDLTIRTSIIGPDMRHPGQGLFDWFFNQQGTISGFDKVIWNGLTTLELAKAIQHFIEQPTHGIYHLAPAEGISKYALLQLLNETFERDLEIKPVSEPAFNRTLGTVRKDITITAPDYPTMIQEMKGWIESHPKLYPHYLTA